MAAETTSTDREPRRCACGYPVPCVRNVPIGFCRQLPPADAQRITPPSANSMRIDDDPSRPGHAAITAGRARLEGKP